MTRTSLMLVHDRCAPAFDPAALRDSDGEPRIRDLDLAQRLGFDKPHNIRNLITRNAVELRTHGDISATAAENTDPQGRGRPGKEYWLNEGQALVICALSRTPQAAMVRKALIDVFLAYRRGQLPAAPETAQLAADVAELRRQIAALAETVGKSVAAGPSSEATPRGSRLPIKASRAAVKGERRAASAEPGRASDILRGQRAIGAYLNMTARQAKYRLKTDDVPVFRLGRTVFAHRSALDAWLAAQYAGSGAGRVPETVRMSFHFHALRHFAASMMIHHGLRGPDVAQLLGHSHFDTTLQVYAHSLADETHHHAAFEGIAAQILPAKMAQCATEVA